MAAREHTNPTDQCIVLPLQPMPGHPYDGVGLALHFLLGNVVVLHSGMRELWFGWRVKKIFNDASLLTDYCRGAPLQIELKKLSQQQKVRFWVYGQYGHQRSDITIGDANQVKPAQFNPLPVSCSDHLVQFRRSFMDGFDLTDVAFPGCQKDAALWEERISLTGLDAVGRALEVFYRFSAFHPNDRLDLEPFEEAVRKAPDAFMAHDLLGWAFYRQGNYPEAIHAFQHAITINHNGAGAMAGLIRCAIHRDNLEETLFWAERKADSCHQDVSLAKEKAAKQFQKHAEVKGQEKS